MTSELARPGKVSEPKRHQTILIVDDEKVIRDLCEKALKDFKVYHAGSCNEALLVYERERCDLILTDVMMPGGNGLELLKRVKEVDPTVVVIIMTGFAEKEVILNALKEGADDFINKPLNLLQLKTAIEKSLAKKKLKEELSNLKQLDRMKSNFLSLISHKLRTPITSISLFLQNLQRGVIDCSDPEFKRTVQLINAEAGYLGRLVADLLTFSKVMIGNEGLQLQPCDLKEILAEALQDSREAQSKPGVEAELVCDALPVMALDHDKVTFAVRQIVDNAFKFSGEQGHVTINLRNAGSSIFIVVSDSGLGIPRSEIPKVFEKFYQIDPDNTGQVRGFGLGLFYAREFIHQHGGSINLDSQPGLGTTVTVSLPIQ